MSNVWLCIPSARPPEEAEKVLKLWGAQGYKIALWCDSVNDAQAKKPEYFISGGSNYPGYAHAVNALVADVIEREPQAEWFVIGGDDVEPDMNHTAEEIAQQTRQYFGATPRRSLVELTNTSRTVFPNLPVEYETFGVMQPTGDRFAHGSIDKICGSAWIGREFARRMYGGNGPLWPEYTRFFMDEELQAVAIKYGVFQQRRDLVHLHRHYMRESDALDAGAIRTEIPEHLKAQEVKWKAEQDIFNKRKHARPTPFPGSEPIP